MPCDHPHLSEPNRTNPRDDPYQSMPFPERRATPGPAGPIRGDKPARVPPSHAIPSRRSSPSLAVPCDSPFQALPAPTKRRAVPSQAGPRDNSVHTSPQTPVRRTDPGRDIPSDKPDPPTPSPTRNDFPSPSFPRDCPSHAKPVLPSDPPSQPFSRRATSRAESSQANPSDKPYRPCSDDYPSPAESFPSAATIPTTTSRSHATDRPVPNPSCRATNPTIPSPISPRDCPSHTRPTQPLRLSFPGLS